MSTPQAHQPRPQRPDRALHAAPSRVALVVSADPAVRADWARSFEALGMQTLRCVEPQVLCVLLDARADQPQRELRRACSACSCAT